MTIPNWYGLILLGLASFRTWRLLALDDILDRPRRRLLRLGNWKADGDIIPPTYLKGVGDFLICPWCSGAWVSLAWWGAYEWSSHWSLVIAVPWAISSLVGAVGSVLSD